MVGLSATSPVMLNVYQPYAGKSSRKASPLTSVIDSPLSDECTVPSTMLYPGAGGPPDGS